jgi:hypothetical protein
MSFTCPLCKRLGPHPLERCRHCGWPDDTRSMFKFMGYDYDEAIKQIKEERMACWKCICGHHNESSKGHCGACGRSKSDGCADTPMNAYCAVTVEHDGDLIQWREVTATTWENAAVSYARQFNDDLDSVDVRVYDYRGRYKQFTLKKYNWTVISEHGELTGR